MVTSKKAQNRNRCYSAPHAVFSQSFETHRRNKSATNKSCPMTSRDSMAAPCTLGSLIVTNNASRDERQNQSVHGCAPFSQCPGVYVKQ